MILERYYLGCLAHASYLIGDERSGTAAIVDPRRDVDQYLDDAAARGLKIEHVLLTHFHADFVSGHLELRNRIGATIYVGGDDAEYDHVSMRDEGVLEFGGTRLSFLETPGHTPESVSVVVFDLDRDSTDPYAVLTGDTLFIGDVGRPDLQGVLGWTRETLAGMLYDSLHQKLLPLPDETLVYPAHGAGSMCGKNPSSDAVSTIGVQRAYNYALQPMPKEAFVEVVTADQPDAPAYFTHDAIINRREHNTLEQARERTLRPLSLDEVLALAEEKNAQVLDVRDPADFEGAHLAGAINIGLGGQYATWCGTLLDAERPIVIVADPGSEEEAATRLGRIGFDHVAGHLDGGMLAAEHRMDLVRHTERITAATLAEHLDEAHPPLVLDVRGPAEWKSGHIAGALHLPLNHLNDRAAEVPRDRSIVVQCRSGYRSSIAASILAVHGLDGLADLVGGISAWEAAKLSTVTP